MLLMSAILRLPRFNRTPWLLLFLGGLLLCALVMHSFEAILEKELELAYFVPMLIGHGGNTGAQASAHHIRALGQAPPGRTGLSRAVRVASGEAFAGLVQGLLLSCAAGPCLWLVMGTSLDPIAFTTIADKPRRQQYYIKMRTVKP